MRKLLVVFLMVALVPFTVGCRINGLWGYDDDDDTPYTATTTPNIIRLAVAIPAGVLSSVRADLFNSNKNLLSAFIKETVAGWVTMDKTFDDAGNLMFFYATNDGTKLALDAAGKIQIKFDNGIDSKIYSVLAVQPTTTASAAETKNYAVEIAFGAGDATVITPFTNVTLTKTTLTDENGDERDVYTFVPATATKGTAESVTPTDENAAHAKIAAVEVAPDGTNFKALSFNVDAPTALGVDNLQGVKFKVTFADDMTEATTSFKVTVVNTSSKNESIIENGEDGLTLDYANKVLTVTITKSVDIAQAAKYQLVFNATSAKNSAGRSVRLPLTAFFRKGTYLSDWTGKMGLIDPTQRSITLQFAGVAIKEGQTLAGTVKLERFASNDTTATPEATFVIDESYASSNINVAHNMVTLTFNQDFVPVKYYKVSYVSGAWLNADGNRIEIHTPIIFGTDNP